MPFLIAYPELPATALLLVLCAVRIWKHPEDRQKNDWLCAAFACSFAGAAVAQALTNWLSLARPLKLDLYIYQIDGWLGIQPSFVLGRIVYRSRSLMYALAAGYSLMPLSMSLVFAAHVLYGRESDARRVARTFILLFVLILPVYALVPVCGPQFAFPGFPYAAPAGSPHPIPISAAPNGIPSGHFATAVLVYWFARRWTLGASLGGAFLVWTGIATVGSGQHYLFDLVVAVPYSALVYRLSQRSWARSRDYRSRVPDKLIVQPGSLTTSAVLPIRPEVSRQ